MADTCTVRGKLGLHKFKLIRRRYWWYNPWPSEWENTYCQIPASAAHEADKGWLR